MTASPEPDSNDSVLRSLFELSPLMMGVADLEGEDIRHVTDNPAAAGFFGRPASELRGRLASELGVPPEGVALWVKHYREAMEQGTSARFEYSHPTERGSRRLSVLVTPLGKNAAGNPRFSYVVQDVTAVKSELQIKSDALENSLNGFDIINERGEFLYANRAYLKMWGYDSLEEILGTSPASHCADPAIPGIIIAKLRESGECNIEFLARRKDGSTFDVHMWARLAYDADGNEIYPTTSVDVTGQKRAKERLEASEERLRLALEAAHLGAYERDLTTSKTNWSAKAREILGIGAAPAEGDFEAFLSRIEPVDREQLLAAATRATQTGGMLDLDYRYHRPDGTIRWLHVYGKAILNNGVPVRTVGVLQDVTDRKRVEEELQVERAKLKSLLLQAPAIFSVTVGPDHVFEIYNLEARRRIGGRDCTGLPIRKALPELEGEGFFEAMDRVYQTGEPIQLKEAPAWLGPEGGEKKLYYFNVVYHPWRTPDGRIGGIMNVSLDVTEQVLARQKVEAALRARDEFLSIVSHELNTPLTSLRLQSQLFQREVQRHGASAYRPERVNQLADQTEKQVGRLARLVEDMLDIGRIRSGKLTLNLRRVSLADLVRDVIERLRPMAESAGIQVRFDCSDPVPGEFDPFRIEQVVQNLLTNAFKYGDHKPVAVTLERVGSRARLSVRDEGIGVSASLQHRIFNRFERGISANEVSGLGLGLFISREIVSAHDGTISVRSAGRGQGSTFIVELPLVRRAESRDTLNP